MSKNHNFISACIWIWIKAASCMPLSALQIWTLIYIVIFICGIVIHYLESIHFHFFSIGLKSGLNSSFQLRWLCWKKSSPQYDSAITMFHSGNSLQSAVFVFQTHKKFQVWLDVTRAHSFMFIGKPCTLKSTPKSVDVTWKNAERFMRYEYYTLLILRLCIWFGFLIFFFTKDTRTLGAIGLKKDKNMH